MIDYHCDWHFQYFRITLDFMPMLIAKDLMSLVSDHGDLLHQCHDVFLLLFRIFDD